MREFLDSWTDYEIAAEEILEAGDSVLVESAERGMGRESGTPVETIRFAVWTFRGRRVIRFEYFRDRDDAREAVGIPPPGSSENVDSHRRSVEAFNSRDVEAFVARCDPQIELHSAVTVPGGATYRGHDGVRAWHRDLADGWGDELSIEPEAYYDLGECTITFHVLHGRGRESGAAVEMPAAHLCEWRDGRIVYFRGFAERDDAFRQAGLSKEAVEPIAP